MRHAALLCVALFAFASNLGAQTDTQNGPFSRSVSFASNPFVSNDGANTEAFSSMPAFHAAVASSPSAAPSFAEPLPAEPPQGVSGVFPVYQFQVAGGYTFIRFYEVPGSTVNANGANFSVAYYLKDWLGVEGEMAATFGSLSGSTSHFLFGGGGLRARHSFPGGFEGWVHALAGGTNFTPQTAYGSTHAFAYEAGGGIDINTHHRRIAYRIEGDAVGTFFFNTYQVSPKVSVGIVYNF
ncbi:MAG TPA: hypothetical protein VLY23_19100 [Candidatus Acidoferrum sp.]|nr:hypothetical protein [Candidatus Acidoferrum sp.]